MNSASEMLALLFLSLPLVVLGVGKKPVDLTHYFDENTLVWASGKHFQFTKKTTSSPDNWYAANEFETAEHGGTHLDAPFHFNLKGWQIGDIPLERFIGKGVHVDLRDKVGENRDFLAEAENFQQWETLHGILPEGSIVLLNFGWAEKYGNASDFFGTDNITDAASYHFPGLGESGARWLADSGKVYGVGTDTASMDYGMTKNYPAHKILSEKNIYNLEHLNLHTEADLLPARGFRVVALPMKIRNGTGAPVRVMVVP